MAEQFKNDAETTLSSGINDSVTSLTVVDASTFPLTGNFRIRIDNEILLVTGVSGNNFTVTRGAESTAAASHLSSAAVVHILTVGALQAGFADISHTHTATQITNTPSGNISSTTVQAAINELDSEKALVSHTHTLSQITDVGTIASQNANNVNITGGSISGISVSGGSFSSTDLTVDTNTLYVDATNNRVGIGTTSPSVQFNTTGDATIGGNLVVTGNLTINGTTTTVDTTNLNVEDNIITLNANESGAGVTAGTAGIEIERGSLTNYRFEFDEATDVFKIGVIGSEQAVATREDNPISNGYAYWNNTLNRFDTTSTIAGTSISNTASGNISSTTVQAAINELDSEKAALSHTHAASDIVSGTINTARLGSGTADGTTFLRGDQTWVTVSGAVSSVFSRTGAVVATAGDYTATQITNTPSGNIASTTVQAALNELDSEKAALSHTHNASDITAGTMATARLGSGTASSNNYLRGDQTWSTINQRWNLISSGSYTATPASTSTITFSDTSGLSVGMPLKYTYNSNTFYGIITTVTANTSIAISGAPLNVSFSITALSVGNPEMVSQMDLFISGSYADTSSLNLLKNKMTTYLRWKSAKAYLVSASVIQGTVASTTQPVINICKNSSYPPSNSGADDIFSTSITLSGSSDTWVDSSAVAVSTTNYVINRNDYIEIRCVTAGSTTTSAQNLTVSLMFIKE